MQGRFVEGRVAGEGVNRCSEGCMGQGRVSRTVVRNVGGELWKRTLGLCARNTQTCADPEGHLRVAPARCVRARWNQACSSFESTLRKSRLEMSK